MNFSLEKVTFQTDVGGSAFPGLSFSTKLAIISFIRFDIGVDRIREIERENENHESNRFSMVSKT